MIKEIDQRRCMKCGLCEDVCPTDVLRRKNGKVYIAYPRDCFNCMECAFVCPTEAIIFNAEVSERFNMASRWEQIKQTLSKPNH